MCNTELYALDSIRAIGNVCYIVGVRSWELGSVMGSSTVIAIVNFQLVLSCLLCLSNHCMCREKVKVPSSNVFWQTES